MQTEDHRISPSDFKRFIESKAKNYVKEVSFKEINIEEALIKSFKEGAKLVYNYFIR